MTTNSSPAASPPDPAAGNSPAASADAAGLFHASKVSKIQRVVADHFGITVNELLSDRRSQRLVRPRYMAMHISADLVKLSLPALGRLFDRDHTSVMHGIRKSEDYVARYAEYEATLNVLTMKAKAAIDNKAEVDIEAAALVAFDTMAAAMREWVRLHPMEFLKSSLSVVPFGTMKPPFANKGGGS